MHGAIENYDIAIRYRPNYSEAYHNKGLTLAILGQFQNAIEHFDLAIKYDPNDLKAYIIKDMY
nr:tetratricopeptide repeat protein [Orientia tsutsugamushi]